MSEEYDWGVVRKFIGFILVCLFLIGSLGFAYQSLMIPISISLFFSYIFGGVVNRFERLCPRVLVVSVLLLLTVLVATILSVTLFPALYREVMHIVRKIPAAVDLATNIWLPYLSDLAAGSGLVEPDEVAQWILEISSMAQFSEGASQALSTILHSVPRFLGTVLNVVLVPLITFFLLLHAPGIKAYLRNYIPVTLRPMANNLLSRIDETLSAVIKGQVIVAATLGGLYVIGFSFIGIEGAFFIGLLAGICRIIPYVDIVVAASLGLVAIFSNYTGIGQVIGLLIVISAIQAFDGMFITPRIIGERVGLHPAVVIVSVLSFGSTCGFLGVLLAIPVVAIFKALWVAAVPYYFATKIYKS